VFENDWVCPKRLGGSKAISMYNLYLKNRRNQHPYENVKYSDVVNEVHENGYAIMKSAIDINLLNAIKTKSEAIFSDPRRLKTNDVKYKTVRHPFIDCPEILNLALSETIFNVVSQFYGCIPALTGGKIHRSYAYTGEKTGTHLYHIDKNSLWFIKAFVYLNDVGLNGGPFTYVRGSHKNRFDGWNNHYRYSDQQIISEYGEKNIKPITASVGDVIFANTVGMHKAQTMNEGHRTMVTLNFCVHPEDWSPQSKFIMVRHTDLNEVETGKKILFDYTRKIR
tara:strand:- start:735 stop:1574 length:840 start_codon:yes stop_codon:yes gene_type:complete